MSKTTHPHSARQHLRSDFILFGIIFAFVLSGVVGLYIYDLKTGVVGQFASTLFAWLID